MNKEDFKNDIKIERIISYDKEEIYFKATIKLDQVMKVDVDILEKLKDINISEKDFEEIASDKLWKYCQEYFSR